MSQFYNNSPNSTTVNSDTVNQNDECWADLLENLTIFITAASNLVQTLQQTIELSKVQNGEGFDENFVCACTKLSENIAGISMKDANEIKLETTTNADKLLEGTQIGIKEGNAPETPEKENCKCVDLSGESRGPEKQSKSKIHCKSKLGKKQPKEIYSKEKTEKLAKLRENLRLAQKNFVDIQEQVRQLERLYQDYDSSNTVEGQVNPAALYREIMKPNSVPYVTTDNSHVSRSQVCQKTSGCTGPCVNKSMPRPEAGYKNPAQCRQLQDKVSILSTVPYR